MKLVNETRQSEAQTSPLKPIYDVKAAESKEAKALIPWAAQNADSGEFIRNENGTIKKSDRYFNSDGSRAPEIKF